MRLATLPWLAAPSVDRPVHPSPEAVRDDRSRMARPWTAALGGTGGGPRVHGRGTANDASAPFWRTLAGGSAGMKRRGLSGPRWDREPVGVLRYVIWIPGDDPWRRAPLQRAIDRLDLGQHRALRGIEVQPPNGSLRIAFDLEGRPRYAAREAERAFASLWYDAFGERGAPHCGDLVEPAIQRARPARRRDHGE